jgi:hypothetical protein
MLCTACAREEFLLSALAEIAKAPTPALDSTSILKWASQPAALTKRTSRCSCSCFTSCSTGWVTRLSLHQPPLSCCTPGSNYKAIRRPDLSILLLALMDKWRVPHTGHHILLTVWRGSKESLCGHQLVQHRQEQ